MSVVTVKVRLNLESEQLSSIKQTIIEYNKVFNLFIGAGILDKSTSYMTLHSKYYFVAKELCPTLSTNVLQVSAKAALGALKSYNSNNPKKRWQLTCNKKSMTMNYNLLSMSLRGSLLTLSTVNKRIRTLIAIPQWFIDKYKVNQNQLHFGTLKIDKKGRATISLSYRIPDVELREEGEVIGLDRGLYNLVTTSEGKIYNNNKKNIAVKRKYQYNRKTLQQKGTKSAKRKLQKVSGKEKRFMQDVNHCISKELASSKDVKVYVLEDLKGAGKSTKKTPKKLRSWLGNWSFYKFQQQLEYKCAQQGIKVDYVDPRYTSQKCSCCGNVDKEARKKSKYICPKCGTVLHADINAAINIKNNYVRAQERGTGRIQPAECI